MGGSDGGMTGGGGAGGACATEIEIIEPAANTATTSTASEPLRIVISSQIDRKILLPLPRKDEDE